MMTSIRATTIFALVLTTAIVGCARRPAVMSMATPPPVDSSVTPPGAGSDPTVLVIEERRDENIVAERPAPAAFSDNRNVKAIYFDFDRYDIRPNDAQVLKVDAAWLKTNDMLILVEGQCDERGTAECNLALGDRRAQAAKNYLVALGISASRIGTVSYGKERPVCAEHTEDCWAANRRGNGLRGVRLFRLGARLHEAGRLHTLTRALRWTVRNEAARCTPPTGRHVRTYEPSTPHPIV